MTNVTATQTRHEGKVIATALLKDGHLVTIFAGMHTLDEMITLHLSQYPQDEHWLTS